MRRSSAGRSRFRSTTRGCATRAATWCWSRSPGPGMNLLLALFGTAMLTATIMLCRERARSGRQLRSCRPTRSTSSSSTSSSRCSTCCPCRRSTAAMSSKACFPAPLAVQFRRARPLLTVHAHRFCCWFCRRSGRRRTSSDRSYRPIVDWHRAACCSGLFGLSGREMLHGWIILDKPRRPRLDPGRRARSSACCARPASRKTKVGHGGTLDPLASGVLPIALGEATKLAGRMLDATKAYDFTIRFGEETDTLDAEGEVVATSDVRPTRGAGRSGPAALHRRDRAGPAGLFGAQDRRQARPTTAPAPASSVELKPRARDDPRSSHFGSHATADERDPLRHRLQGHLHPQPRPRHRPCAWTRSAMSPC